MGPLFLASRQTYDPANTPEENAFQEVCEHPDWDDMDRTQIAISATTSPKAIAETEIENRRRRMADRIGIALESNIRDIHLLLQDPTSYKAKMTAEQGQPPKVRHNYQLPPRNNSRYSDIEGYLFKNIGLNWPWIQ